MYNIIKLICMRKKLKVCFCCVLIYDFSGYIGLYIQLCILLCLYSIYNIYISIYDIAS